MPFLGWRRREHRARRWTRIGLAVAACSLLTGVGTAWAAFSAQAVNTANTFSSGTLQLRSVTPDTVTCYSTGIGSGGTVTSNVTSCPGDPLPTSELVTGTGVNATTALSSPGTTAPTSLIASSLACGVEQVADASSAANPGLIYDGVTYGTPFTSPVSSGFTSTGVTFDGNAGSFIGTTVQYSDPTPFSLVSWVKTTSTSGGSIIGFSNNQSDKGATADRMIWVDDTGNVVFEVQKGSTDEQITSANTVADGAWHLVVATFSTAGMFLYVDNQVVSNTAITTVKSYAGYWHLGWSGNAGLTDASNDAYLTGSLADAAVLSSVLSAAQVSSLYEATSASTYAGVLQAAAPDGYWPLTDTGTTPYTGQIPALNAGVSICSRVRFELQATAGLTTTCVFPAGSGACAAKPAATSLLSSFSSGAMPLISAALSNYSVKVIMDLNNASASGVLGLHLEPDLAVTSALGPWSAQLQYLAASAEL